MPSQGRARPNDARPFLPVPSLVVVGYHAAGTQVTYMINEHMHLPAGLAVGRTIIAVLENYQEVDGTVTVRRSAGESHSWHV